MSCLYLPLLPPMWHSGLLSCWLSLPFPPIISFFLQNRPLDMNYFSLMPCIFIFFPSKPLLQFVELISILVLLSSVFALAPSVVPLVNLISVLSIPSSRLLLMKMVNRTQCLPSLPAEGFQGVFPHRELQLHRGLMRMLSQLPVG